MSQLRDNLNEILTQKNNYLLPENLKKNVTLLGVTGTYEGSGTSGGVITLPSAAIHLYMEDMDPDTGDMIWVLDHEIPMSAVADTVNHIAYISGTSDFDFSLAEASCDEGTLLCNYDIKNSNTICIPIDYSNFTGDISQTSLIININE